MLNSTGIFFSFPEKLLFRGFLTTEVGGGMGKLTVVHSGTLPQRGRGHYLLL